MSFHDCMISLTMLMLDIRRRINAADFRLSDEFERDNIGLEMFVRFLSKVGVWSKEGVGREAVAMNASCDRWTGFESYVVLNCHLEFNCLIVSFSYSILFMIRDCIAPFGLHRSRTY